MSTTGTEKHCRLCLMLNKGGTKACHHLFLKRVRELSPKDHQPYPWTVHQFLQSKRKTIKKSNISKDKFNRLFPTTGDTDLSKWDLSLYCTVLILYCELAWIVKLDVERFQTLRNDLCHMNEPNVTNSEYEDKLGTIKVIIDRIVENIDDRDVKQVITNIMEKVEEGPLSLDETLKEMHKFYLMEDDIREKLDHVHETMLQQFEQLGHKLESFHKKLDHSSSANSDNARNNVLVPGVNIFLDFKDVSEDEEETMSEVLCKLFEEIINEDEDFKSSIPADSHVKLREVSEKTFKLFMSKGWKIVSAKHECIQLHIKCNSFKSLACLFREQVNGQIDEQLKEVLQESMYGRKLGIETTIFKDEFWSVLEKSISSVDEYITMCSVGSISTNDIEQSGDETNRHTLTLTARHMWPEQEHSTSEGHHGDELETCLLFLKSNLESGLGIDDITIKTRKWTKGNSHDAEKVGEREKETVETSTKTKAIKEIEQLKVADIDMVPQNKQREVSTENLKAIKEIEQMRVADIDIVPQNKKQNVSTETLTDLPVKEESTSLAGQEPVTQEDALKGVFSSSRAILCYLELAGLTLFDTDLHRKVYQKANEMRYDIVKFYLNFGFLARRFGFLCRYDWYRHYVSESMIEYKDNIKEISKNRQRVENMILELESRMKIKGSTTQKDKVARETYDQLQKLYADEELLTEERTRKLDEYFVPYKTTKQHPTLRYMGDRDVTYEQLSKSPHTYHTYKMFDDTSGDATTSLKDNVISEKKIKQSQLYDTTKGVTKDKTSIGTYGESIKKKMLSQTSSMSEPFDHVMKDYTYDIPIHQIYDERQEKTRTYDVPIEKKLFSQTSSMSDPFDHHMKEYTYDKASHPMYDERKGKKPHETLRDVLEEICRPGPALLGDGFIGKLDDTQRVISRHKTLFSDPLFENSEFLQEVKEFYSELTKQDKEEMTETLGNPLQLKGGYISHRCMQRAEVHFERLDIQLKRINIVTSRIEKATKVTAELDLGLPMTSSDTRQEWEQVGTVANAYSMYLVHSPFCMQHAFKQFREDEREVELRKILQESN